MCTQVMAGVQPGMYEYQAERWGAELIGIKNNDANDEIMLVLMLKRPTVHVLHVILTYKNNYYTKDTWWKF